MEAENDLFHHKNLVSARPYSILFNSLSCCMVQGFIWDNAENNNYCSKSHISDYQVQGRWS